MFELGDFKQTRFYQEAFDDGVRREKLRTVPLMLKLGLTVEEVARELGLSVVSVQQAAPDRQSS